MYINVGIIAMLFQLTSLGADELKVAELVGVQPGILSKKGSMKLIVYMYTCAIPVHPEQVPMWAKIIIEL